MPSISEIPNSRSLLDQYLDPANGYAWPLYDADPAPSELTGADLTAPALLSYPVAGQHLNEMGRHDTPYWHLVQQMRLVLAADEQSFLDLDRSRVTELSRRTRGETTLDDAFGRLVSCFDLVADCPGLTSVFVTKVLHRKRPNLVPINDSRVRDFYGVPHEYAPLMLAIYDDATRHADLLADLVASVDAHLTHLRALDIIVWMHQA